MEQVIEKSTTYNSVCKWKCFDIYLWATLFESRNGQYLSWPM